MYVYMNICTYVYVLHGKVEEKILVNGNKVREKLKYDQV